MCVDNFVVNKIKDLMTIQGEIGLTVKVGLFSGLRAQHHTQSGSNSLALEVGFIALLAGGIGVVTTLYTSVNERTKEIGTMKAIGAKPWFILSLF
jgi:ABC-type antimicrobial peptide transport system permease subunit